MTLSLLRNMRASAHHALYYSSAAQNAIWFGQSSFLPARIHVPKHDKYTLSNVSISYAQYVIGFPPLMRLTDGGGHWACLPCNPRRALFHSVLQSLCHSSLRSEYKWFWLFECHSKCNLTWVHTTWNAIMRLHVQVVCDSSFLVMVVKSKKKHMLAAVNSNWVSKY